MIQENVDTFKREKSRRSSGKTLRELLLNSSTVVSVYRNADMSCVLKLKPRGWLGRAGTYLLGKQYLSG